MQFLRNTLFGTTNDVSTSSGANFGGSGNGNTDGASRGPPGGGSFNNFTTGGSSSSSSSSTTTATKVAKYVRLLQAFLPKEEEKFFRNLLQKIESENPDGGDLCKVPKKKPKKK